MLCRSEAGTSGRGRSDGRDGKRRRTASATAHGRGPMGPAADASATSRACSGPVSSPAYGESSLLSINVLRMCLSPGNLLSQRILFLQAGGAPPPWAQGGAPPLAGQPPWAQGAPPRSATIALPGHVHAAIQIAPCYIHVPGIRSQ